MTDVKELVERIAHAAIAVEYGPERYADQAQAGNWPIWRVAVAAARSALLHPIDDITYAGADPERGEP